MRELNLRKLIDRIPKIGRKQTNIPDPHTVPTVPIWPDPQRSTYPVGKGTTVPIPWSPRAHVHKPSYHPRSRQESSQWPLPAQPAAISDVKKGLTVPIPWNPQDYNRSETESTPQISPSVPLPIHPQRRWIEAKVLQQWINTAAYEADIINAQRFSPEEPATEDNPWRVPGVAVKGVRAPKTVLRGHLHSFPRQD